MFIYRYRPFQAGENIWCRPESQVDQNKMLSDLNILGLEIVEKSLKQIPLWSKQVKLYAQQQKLNGGYTRGPQLKPTYRTVFGKNSVQLQNSGQHGYEKAKSQSPAEIIVGQCRKFQKIIANGEHLSPAQIRSWNQAIDNAKCAKMQNNQGQDQLCSLTSILDNIYKGPNWETRDLPLLQQSEYMRLLNQLSGMYIRAVDLDQKDIKAANQKVIDQTSIIESIQ